MTSAERTALEFLASEWRSMTPKMRRNGIHIDGIQCQKACADDLNGLVSRLCKTPPLKVEVVRRSANKNGRTTGNTGSKRR